MSLFRLPAPLLADVFVSNKHSSLVQKVVKIRQNCFITLGRVKVRPFVGDISLPMFEDPAAKDIKLFIPFPEK